MMRIHSVSRVLAIAAFAAAAASCGDVVRDGRSSVIISMDLLQAAQGNKVGSLVGNLNSDVLTIVTSGGTCSIQAPCPTVFNDVGAVTLRLVPKDLGTGTTPTAPTTNNEVTITRYHVDYRRADGRNTPGVDVPFGFDGAVTGTIPASGTLQLGFELVRIVAKQEAPLAQLVSNFTFLSTLADVTFYGKDRVGNDISVTGTILITFGNFGDA